MRVTMFHETVLITGASGFIGQSLVDDLLAHDFQVLAFSRKKDRIAHHPHLRWIQSLEEIQQVKLDYVINLAGESIGQGRWSQQRKQQLVASRVHTTRMLYQYLQKNHLKPKCIISGSAVGYYGIDPAEQWQHCCDEQSAPQAIFMSELCQQWEQEALSYSDQNTKIMRLGVVFGAQGGILPQMLLPIKLNLAGRIGHGRQPMTWVHIDDVISVIKHLMGHQSSQQIYNVVAPDHLSQQQFAQFAAKCLKRKPLFAVPAWVMQFLMGEQSQLVLNGQYVHPQALLDEGYVFQYPDIQSALQQLLQSKR